MFCFAMLVIFYSRSQTLFVEIIFCNVFVLFSAQKITQQSFAMLIVIRSSLRAP